MSTIPPPPHRPRLGDTWNSRDFPVLLEISHLADTGQRVLPAQVASATGLTEEDVDLAIEALVLTGLLIENRNKVKFNGGGDRYIILAGWLNPSERGRRLVGLWPSQQTALELMLEQLQAIADNPATTEDGRSRAKKILDAFAGTGREIAVQVAASIITGQLVTSSPGQLTEPPTPTW